MVILEIGNRSPGDRVHLSLDDIQAVMGPDGRGRFARKDKTPYRERLGDVPHCLTIVSLGHYVPLTWPGHWRREVEARLGSGLSARSAGVTPWLPASTRRGM